MERTRQQALFDEWFRLHQGLVGRILRAYAFTAHDRDDLLQELALQLWKSIPLFRGESKVTTWIYRVGLRTALAWSQRERARREEAEPLAEPGAVLAPVPLESDPRLDWIYARIARLEPVDRSLILLHLDGLSQREIAETLGIREGNVGVKLGRIKKSMASESPERVRDGLR
ncbi:MAG: sigma-70 family RNA polymerase sigma factor [Planctomycetes bacterium]|nr:sigma-70 family RNA polymerase sigma factor [Planctomycetota bacterium]